CRTSAPCPTYTYSASSSGNECPSCSKGPAPPVTPDPCYGASPPLPPGDTQSPVRPVAEVDSEPDADVLREVHFDSRVRQRLQLHTVRTAPVGDRDPRMDVRREAETLGFADEGVTQRESGLQPQRIKITEDRLNGAGEGDIERGGTEIERLAELTTERQRSVVASIHESATNAEIQPRDRAAGDALDRKSTEVTEIYAHAVLHRRCRKRKSEDLRLRP